MGKLIGGVEEPGLSGSLGSSLPAPPSSVAPPPGMPAPPAQPMVLARNIKSKNGRTPLKLMVF
ncbi:MAG TPA: hypothetical protein DDW49_08470 [Deltaproteobacteria bacterium]|nr:hypothetical protein [Deltaproteobacteria bacterium]